MTDTGEGDPIFASAAVADPAGSADPTRPVKYIQRTRTGGVLRLYFRKGGYREGPLASPDGSPELAAEVTAILARLTAAEAAQAAPRAGTVGGMLKAYAGHVDREGRRTGASAAFLALARATQAAYADIVDELIEDCGDHPLHQVTRPWLSEMRDAWALRGHRVANVRLSILSNALSPAIEDERVPADPFPRLKRARRPRDRGEPNPIWTDAEVEAAIEAAIARGRPGLARAIALGRYGGFRRGGICAIPLHARVDDDQAAQAASGRPVPKGGRPRPSENPKRLCWVTPKRQVLCDKREDARLAAVLDRTPDRALTLAYNADGHPWKPRQLNQALDRHLAALAKAQKVRSAADPETGEIYCPLTIHGLRHARGVELAHAGASDAEIMAQLEHATDRQAKDYRRQADRRRLAEAAQTRVDNVVNLKARRKPAPRQANASGTEP